MSTKITYKYAVAFINSRNHAYKTILEAWLAWKRYEIKLDLLCLRYKLEVLRIWINKKKYMILSQHKTALKWCKFVYKNIERHTADTIVSWPNPKKWVIVHTSDLMMIIRQSIYILSIVTSEMGKLKTYNPTYCIMDNGENVLNLTHSTKYIWQAFYKFNAFR